MIQGDPRSTIEEALSTIRWDEHGHARAGAAFLSSWVARQRAISAGRAGSYLLAASAIRGEFRYEVRRWQP